MSSSGQEPAQGRGRGDQVQPQFPKTNQDPQGKVQALSPDLTGLLAEFDKNSKYYSSWWTENNTVPN